MGTDGAKDDGHQGIGGSEVELIPFQHCGIDP
jgi:hypothetical protein